MGRAIPGRAWSACFCYLPLQILRLLPLPSPLSTSEHSRWHRRGMGLGGEVKRSQECFAFSIGEGTKRAPELRTRRRGIGVLRLDMPDRRHVFRAGPRATLWHDPHGTGPCPGGAAARDEGSFPAVLRTDSPPGVGPAGRAARACPHFPKVLGPPQELSPASVSDAPKADGVRGPSPASTTTITSSHLLRAQAPPRCGDLLSPSHPPEAGSGGVLQARHGCRRFRGSGTGLPGDGSMRGCGHHGWGRIRARGV